LRRLAILIAGGAVWLILAAVPALADGGPHVSTINNGTAGISADSCAGCHRAHTAQAEYLLVEEVPALCLTCHGSTGAGATTDVMSGIQYELSAIANEVRGTAILGALRSGGFAEARIGSGNAARLAYTSGTHVRQLGMVPVLDAGQAVTSTHMDITDPTSAIAWGNGPISGSANPGGTTTLNCTSCHNPHGNGQYRILNPIPGGDAPATGGTMTVATVPAPVTDAPLPAAGDTRNYTVIQQKGTQGTDSSYLLYASQVVTGGYADNVGDYLHRRVPWNSGTGANDAPNGQPANGTFNGVAQTAFNDQINLWCAQCHTRYNAASGSWGASSGDAIFNYRHPTTSNKPCTTCHVSHGSNAQMTGVYSATMEYPGGAVAPVGDSRLLKVDNRGTCQACHDPTETVTSGTYIGPVPTPVVP